MEVVSLLAHHNLNNNQCRTMKTQRDLRKGMRGLEKVQTQQVGCWLLIWWFLVSAYVCKQQTNHPCPSKGSPVHSGILILLLLIFLDNLQRPFNKSFVRMKFSFQEGIFLPFCFFFVTISMYEVLIWGKKGQGELWSNTSSKKKYVMCTWQQWVLFS